MVTRQSASGHRLVCDPSVARATAPRLTSDGMVRSCLFSTEETSLRDLLRVAGTMRRSPPDRPRYVGQAGCARAQYRHFARASRTAEPYWRVTSHYFVTPVFSNSGGNCAVCSTERPWRRTPELLAGVMYVPMSSCGLRHFHW